MKERILLVLSLILTVAGFVSAQTPARKTVTNADLEKFRQKRLQAEADYRANYKRLGMPSPEELEQREAERQRWLAEFAQKAEIERRENENYFLSRANELRTEIASVDAQINYLHGSVNRGSEFVGGTVWSPGYYGGIAGVVYGGGRFRRGAAGVGPNVQTVRNYARSFPTVGAIRNQIYGTYPQLNRFPRRSGRGFYGGGYAVGGYYSGDDLESRLSQLEQQRAGLLAEWQQLEEEARQAGVRID